MLESLARRVVAGVAAGDRGWRTEYRIRRLIGAGDRGAQVAVDALWECWLLTADDRWWTVLLRWNRPAAFAWTLNSGLFDPGQVHRLSRVALDDPAHRCTAEGLAEALGRTGHPIAEIARRHLSRPAAHVLDTLDGAPRTAAVVDYLTGRLVRDHDWDGLWRFARDLPPADAAEALRHADPRWRPPDRAGDELYTLLRDADPEHLRELVTLLATPRILPTDRPVLRGAFSADERLMAVTLASELRVYDVASGTRLAAHELDEIDPGPVSFEGDAPIVVQRWPGEPVLRSTVWRFGPGRRTGRSVNGWVYDLRPGTLDGTSQVASARRAPGLPWPEVSLIRRHGPPAIRRPEGVADLRCMVLDTDPVDRRVAFAGDRITVAGLGPGNRLRGPVHSYPRISQDWRGLCLAGPDLVFSCDATEVVGWRVDGGLLRPAVIRRHGHGAIAWAPYRNAVAATDWQHGLQYLDADTLEPQDVPGDLYGLRARQLWSAPLGTGTHAAAADGEIRLVLASVAGLAHLARQPMSRGGLGAVRPDPVMWDRAAALVEVLAANDRYRASVRSAG
ncbi:hypothetical protein SAMN05421541_104162 [Actinoplanes philippinensis]|uniref:Uncharacterized protein n=1 Tax=Actinoplanes philippinensis TaxID=35752 RepID=A0A1I2E4E9_9ACTN|nr:hypothetical protein SAMN05421541_104162 [Actinoplanes philippinensis]